MGLPRINQRNILVLVLPISLFSFIDFSLDLSLEPCSWEPGDSDVSDTSAYEFDTVFIVLGIWYEAGVYEGDLSELEPEFVGMRHDAAAVIGLGFMGALDKCGFQGKVWTTMRRHMRISCQVPLYHLSSPTWLSCTNLWLWSQKKIHVVLTFRRKTPCIRSKTLTKSIKINKICDVMCWTCWWDEEMNRQ